MTVSIEVYLEGADRLMAGLERAPVQQIAAARSALLKSTLAVEAAAKARVPRRTGRLFSSITSEVSGAEIGRVYTDVRYASMVELGTRPHDIAPVRAQALMIPIASEGGFGGGRLSGAPRAGQQVAFFRRVHHPGTKGRPFMREALEASVAAIEAFFKAATAAVVAAIAKGA